MRKFVLRIGLIMCRGEKLMHEWGIVSWLKFRECKKLGRSNIKLVKIVKNDLSIEKVT